MIGWGAPEAVPGYWPAPSRRAARERLAARLRVIMRRIGWIIPAVWLLSIGIQTAIGPTQYQPDRIPTLVEQIDEAQARAHHGN